MIWTIKSGDNYFFICFYLFISSPLWNFCSIWVCQIFEFLTWQIFFFEIPKKERKERDEIMAAEHRANLLTIIGDLPDEHAEPDKNVLFVCKLNPVTTDEDLELIFSRFGDIKT